MIVMDRYEVGRGLPEDPEERVYVDPAAVRLRCAKKLAAALDDAVTVRDIVHVVKAWAWLVGAHVPVEPPRRYEDLPVGAEPLPEWMKPQPGDPKPDTH